MTFASDEEIEKSIQELVTAIQGVATGTNSRIVSCALMVILVESAFLAQDANIENAKRWVLSVLEQAFDEMRRERIEMNSTPGPMKREDQS